MGFDPGVAGMAHLARAPETNHPRSESVRAWRPARVGGLFLAGRTARYAVEPAGNWVIGAVTAGQMRAGAKSGRELFGPGDLCVWPGDAAHDGDSPDGRGWDARLIILDAELMAEIPAGTTHRRQEGRLFGGFMRLHQASQDVDDTIESELLDWLDDLAGPVGDGGGRPPSQAVRIARQVDPRRYTQPMSLEALASAAATDKYSLAKSFKRELGVAPHRYLIGRRVAVAQRSLAAGLSISEAALAAGFFDQSHLNRHFTRRLGFTPAQLVRALRH